jgi:phytoene dehydrogenase-like protein
VNLQDTETTKMQDTYNYLIDALRAAPTVLDALLHDCTQEQAQATRGGDEGWTMIEVICHLRDNEERVLERVRLMRDETDPFIAAYDQERWAKERNYAADNLREALAAFVRLRASHVAELMALTPADWERTGRHEERGRITIGIQTLRLVCHDAIHAAQLARQLG